MPRVSLSEFKAIKAKALERKAKKAENAEFQQQVKNVVGSGSRNGLKTAAKGSRSGETGSGGLPARKRRKPSARKVAFKQLKTNRDTFVFLRCKHRNGGLCEVGVVCGGTKPAEVVYHVFPAAMGNAIKHDPRNLLAACNADNGGEYFARKRGSDVYVNRHRQILGDDLFNELKALQGRKQISTVEAREMNQEYIRKIEAGEYR